MEFKYIITDSDESIKQILKNKFNMSERYILKLKKNKLIKINNNPVHINYQIKKDDILFIQDNIEEDSSNIVSNPSIELNILYEDSYLLIVNKPANLPVHPSILHYETSLSNGIKAYYEKINLKKKIRPVNRLDKDTSGIVIFAKNEYIQECLVKQMKHNTFKKYYIAILNGILEEKEGTINVPISRKENSIIERTVSNSGEKSITHYKVIDYISPNMSLVEFLLETGRTHQIRVHTKYIGHPILGDSLYGSTSSLISRQALHAYKIEFKHPVSKKQIIIKTSLPKDMESIINN